MLSKAQAACESARRTGRSAAIGGLADIAAMIDRRAGTVVTVKEDGITYR
jgi:carbamate kinase